MKQARVIPLDEYRRKKAKEEAQSDHWPQGLPDARDLWELFDQNLSVRLWKKRVE